jgi:hypothetical protein
LTHFEFSFSTLDKFKTAGLIDLSNDITGMRETPVPNPATSPQFKFGRSDRQHKKAVKLQAADKTVKCDLTGPLKFSKSGTAVPIPFGLSLHRWRIRVFDLHPIR